MYLINPGVKVHVLYNFGITNLRKIDMDPVMYCIDCITIHEDFSTDVKIVCINIHVQLYPLTAKLLKMYFYIV